MNFFLHIIASMNAYAESEKDKKGNFVGHKWKPFRIHEIFHNLGIVLRGGITNCAGGGYISWFVSLIIEIVAI